MSLEVPGEVLQSHVIEEVLLESSRRFLGVLKKVLVVLEEVLEIQGH